MCLALCQGLCPPWMHFPAIEYLDSWRPSRSSLCMLDMCYSVSSLHLVYECSPAHPTAPAISRACTTTDGNINTCLAHDVHDASLYCCTAHLLQRHYWPTSLPHMQAGRSAVLLAIEAGQDAIVKSFVEAGAALDQEDQVCT